MKWIVGWVLVSIMYTSCVISGRCTDAEEERKIEDMIHKVESE